MCSLSGKKTGKRWLAANLCFSVSVRFVSAVAVPPDASTRNKPVVRLPKTITPRLFHVPPRPSATGHKSITDLPATSTIFKKLLVKKPTCLPSGDQNGYEAPSVPGSAVEVVRSSERSDNIRVPLLSEPTTAM